MRNHGCIASFLGHFNSFESFCQRADLVDLDQDGVSDALFNAFLKDGCVGHVEVVADKLHAVTQGFGKFGPAFPVTFGHTVFDGDDRIMVNPFGHLGDPFVSGKFQALTLLVVNAVFIEFAGSAVQTDKNLLSRCVAGRLDGVDNEFDSSFMAVNIRSETSFVTDSSRHAVSIHNLFQSMKDLGAAAKRFAESRQTGRDNHEFLDVEVVVGMSAAVHNVHHRNGQRKAVDAAEITIQRKSAFFSSCACYRQGNSQNGVGAEAGLIRGAVELDHGAVNFRLLAGVVTDNFIADFVVDVGNGLKNTFAVIAGSIAVTKLNGFAAACGSTARDCCASDHAGSKNDLGFNGRIAAGIQYFTTKDFNNFAHVYLLKS